MRKLWPLLIAIPVIAGAWVLISWISRETPHEMPREEAVPYDTATWMPDIQLVERTDPPHKYWGLGQHAGTHILELSRGCPHSTVTTAHGYHQRLTVELTDLHAGTVIDLAKANVRVTYDSYFGRKFWSLKPGTAKGTLRIEGLTDSGATVSYDVTLTAIAWSWFSYVEDEVTFKGHRDFARESRELSPSQMVGRGLQQSPVTDNVFRAAERGDNAAVQEFLNAGVAVDARNDAYLQEGWTALHHACRYGRAQLVRTLLAKGADVKAKARRGTTPLHEAAYTGRVTVAELLIDAGADVNALIREDWASTGCTPLDLAEERRDEAHAQTAALLKQHGAISAHDIPCVRPSEN